MNELEIICLPQDLPEFIEVDLENLELGNSIHISQISLPKGKSLLSQKTSEDPAVVAVQAPKVVADTVDKEADGLLIHLIRLLRIKNQVILIQRKKMPKNNFV